MIQGLLKKYSNTVEKREVGTVRDESRSADPGAEPFDNGLGPLNGWKDSASVSRLSIYLKRHRERGVRLFLRDGSPALKFEPGLNPKDEERWKIAEASVQLLGDAFEDLRELIRRDLIRIPS